jgi:protocatechuate 3,4-dioxygenase beta subunit
LPETLASRSRIAPEDEPGEAMRIEGTVLDPSGHAVPGVIVYAYHTNQRGIYPADDRFKGQAAGRHGRLRGWVKTDGQGRYRFDTIRPAGYPNTDQPAHVHMEVLEVGRCTYYIDEILFDDDPRLTPEKRRQLVAGRGGSGLVMPARDADGWKVTRDILLGEQIPGYSGCAP